MMKFKHYSRSISQGRGSHNMDNRAIGFFDSGLGGLTSVQKLHEILPCEKVLYFGDTARTPYGSKSNDTIIEFSRAITDYLVANDVKMIIIACNTVSAIALESLRREHPGLPILGVIEPTVERVINAGVARVGVIGTRATIASDVYAKCFRDKQSDITVFSKACPLLVPLVEEGFKDTDAARLILKEYLDDFIEENQINDLVLGCTHYPLLSEQISQLFPRLRLFNSSEEVINVARDYLTTHDSLATSSDLVDRYYASDLSDCFLSMTEAMFQGRESKIKLVELDNIV